MHNLVNNGAHHFIGLPGIGDIKEAFFERTRVGGGFGGPTPSGYSRVTGERSGPAGGLGPPATVRQRPAHGQHSPVPPVTVARHRLRLRNCAVRSDQKPLRAESVVRAGFGSGLVAVTQGVHGCYCEPARVNRLWRAIPQPDARPMKDAERRDKRSDSPARRGAMAERPSPQRRRCPNGTAGL